MNPKRVRKPSCQASHFLCEVQQLSLQTFKCYGLTRCAHKLVRLIRINWFLDFTIIRDSKENNDLETGRVSFKWNTYSVGSIYTDLTPATEGVPSSSLEDGNRSNSQNFMFCRILDDRQSAKPYSSQMSYIYIKTFSNVLPKSTIV